MIFAHQDTQVRIDGIDILRTPWKSRAIAVLLKPILFEKKTGQILRRFLLQ